MRNWLFLVALTAIGCSSDPSTSGTSSTKTTSSTGGSGGSDGTGSGGVGGGGSGGATGGSGGATGGSGGSTGGSGGSGGAAGSTGGSAGKAGNGGVSGSGGAAGNTGGTAGKAGGSGSGGSSGAAPDGGGGTGGVVDAGTRPDATMEEQQACTNFADAFCTKLDSCSNFVETVLYGDLATCKQRFVLSCMPNFGAPGTSASPARTNSCAQSIPSLSCSDFLLTKFGSTCLPTSGLTPQNGPCGDDAQCLTTFCARSPTSACGTCQLPTMEGQACVSGSCSVSSGTVCTGAAGSQSCVKPAAGQIGDACIGQEQCDVGHQVGCNTATTKKCLALTLTPSGGQCGANNILNPTSVAVCPNGGTCSGPFAGSCTAFAPDGASCSTGDTGAHCMQPARCIGGKCVIPDPFTCR